MDYEAYTFVFLSKKNKQYFSLKCDIYYAFTFQPYNFFFNASYLYVLKLN